MVVVLAWISYPRFQLNADYTRLNFGEKTGDELHVTSKGVWSKSALSRPASSPGLFQAGRNCGLSLCCVLLRASATRHRRGSATFCSKAPRKLGDGEYLHTSTSPSCGHPDWKPQPKRVTPLHTIEVNWRMRRAPAMSLGSPP